MFLLSWQTLKQQDKSAMNGSWLFDGICGHHKNSTWKAEMKYGVQRIQTQTWKTLTCSICCFVVKLKGAHAMGYGRNDFLFLIMDQITFLHVFPDPCYSLSIWHWYVFHHTLRSFQEMEATEVLIHARTKLQYFPLELTDPCSLPFFKIVQQFCINFHL